MARPDPLAAAFGYYAAEKWGESEWRRFGRETGTADILSRHPRLFRSLSFGDDDYPEAAVDIAGAAINGAAGDDANEKERMFVVAEAVADLPEWIEENAPTRTKRLFKEYLDARDASEIPAEWYEGQVTDRPESLELPAFILGDRVEASPPTSAPAFPEPFDRQPATPTWVPSVPAAESKSAPTPEIFMVHGHDEAALNSVRVYVYRQTGIMPTSLAEEASGGQTIIEKFESYGSKATFVIVLLTPDDMGQTVGDHDNGERPTPRARQNVIMELGYFIGTLGRKKIIVVNAGVEKPSDVAGVGYVEYPGTNWMDQLRTELDAAHLLKK